MTDAAKVYGFSLRFILNWLLPIIFSEDTLIGKTLILLNKRKNSITFIELNHLKSDAMGLFPLLPLLFAGVFYIVILAGIFLLIYSWVRKFITLREEQNDLLREIIKKMDKK